MTDKFQLIQLPIAERITAIMELYLRKLPEGTELTDRERLAFAGLFAWIPTIIVNVSPVRQPTEEPKAPDMEFPK